MTKRFLSTVSVPSLESEPSGHSGSIYFNTLDKTLHVHDGTGWSPASVEYIKTLFLGAPEEVLQHDGIQIRYDSVTNRLVLSLEQTEYTKSPNGFVNYDDAIIEWDSGIKRLRVYPRTFTEYKGNYDPLAEYAIGDVILHSDDRYYKRIISGEIGDPPSGASWQILSRDFVQDSYIMFVTGKKIIKKILDEWAPPSELGIYQEGTYHVYFDRNGTLKGKLGGFDLSEDCPVAVVLINSDGDAVFVADDRSNLAVDYPTKEYLRKTGGLRIDGTGFSIGDYTTSGVGTSENDYKFSISNGTVYNIDRFFTITHSSTPTLEYEQFLNPYVKTKTFYRQEGHWDSTDIQDYSIVLSSGVPAYNSVTEGSWSLTPVPDNKFFAVWIAVTNNVGCPIVAINGQSFYNNLNDALDSASFGSLNLDGSPEGLYAPLYRLIFQYNATYTNTPKSILKSVLDIRSSSASGGGGATITDHGGLSGLTDDDHTQYVHLSNARTITANHTFNPPSPQAAFTLGTNAAGQLISGLNAEKVGGKTYSEINQESFTYAQNAVTDAVQASKEYTDQEIADLVGTAPELLNTLGELSDALADDANFATTVTNALAGKANTVHSHTKNDITDFTEEVQDAAASLFNHINHNNITVTYDDVNNKIIFTALAQLTEDQVQDFVAPLLTHTNHTNIEASYDDEANQLVLEAIIPPSKAIMSATAPTSPADGDFWFDTDEFRSGTTRALKIWNALTSTWEYVSSDLSLSTTNTWTAKNTFNQGVIIGLNSAPSTPSTGQIYYDTTTFKLRAYNGTSWVNIEGGGGGGAAFDLISTDTTQVPAIMFFGASAPTSGSYSVGDLWVDIDDDAGATEFIHVGPDAPNDYGTGTLWVDTDEPELPLIYSDEEPPSQTPIEGDFWVDIDDLAGQLVVSGETAPNPQEAEYWVDTTTEEGLETFTVKNVYEGNRSVFSIPQNLPDPSTHGGMVAFVESEQQFYVAYSDVPPIQNGLAYTVTLNNNQFRINNLTKPTLNIERGKRYAFSVNTPGHPFWIKTKAIVGTNYDYPTGLSANGIQDGIILFDVPYNAPDKLYYVSQNNDDLFGEINITGQISPTGRWEPLVPDVIQENITTLLWMGF